VFAFALAPVSGAVGDRVGLGRLLVAGLLIDGIGTGLLAARAGVTEAFVAVALVSVGSALIFPSLNGMVAAQLPPERRSRAYALRFGVLNAGIGIGGLVSGSVVSLDRPASFQIVYLVDAASTIVFAALVVLGMRRTPGYAAAAPDGVAGSGPVPAAARGYRSVLSNRPFLGFLVCSFLFALFGYAQLDGPWAAYATLVVGVDPQVVGIGFAANTAVIVVCQLGVARLTTRWRRSRLLAGAAGLWAVAWATSALTALPALHGLVSALALVVSLAIFGLGETLFSPVAGGLPNELATDDLRSRYNALGSTAFSVATFLGPPAAGVLLGSPAPWLWAPAVTVGMLVAVLGAVLLGRILPSSVDRPPEAPEIVRP
jgi:MFS family permease